MTAKEKAKELFSIYYEYTETKVCCVNCCYRVVDEVTSALYEYGNDSHELQNMDSELRFWESVKQEIKKL